MAGELESDSVALERVREYEDLPQVPHQKTKRPIEQKTSDSGGRLGVWGALGWELAINRRDQVWWVRENSVLIFVLIDLCGCVIIPTSLLCKLTCVRYATKYRSELPCVLENFNLDVLDNEKVNRLAEEILANFHRLALLVALGLASPVWA